MNGFAIIWFQLWKLCVHINGKMAKGNTKNQQQKNLCEIDDESKPDYYWKKNKIKKKMLCTFVWVRIKWMEIEIFKLKWKMTTD